MARVLPKDLKLTCKCGKVCSSCETQKPSNNKALETEEELTRLLRESEDLKRDIRESITRLDKSLVWYYRKLERVEKTEREIRGLIRRCRNTVVK